jgi:hypothetical protein
MRAALTLLEPRTALSPRAFLDVRTALAIVDSFLSFVALLGDFGVIFFRSAITYLLSHCSFLEPASFEKHLTPESESV